MTGDGTARAGPARNRVTPLGEVVAAPGRGTLMGNRGRLHDGEGSRDVRRHHVGRAWITCLLDFRGRRVAQWHPHRYTPLFFLDEPLALAAGHRPCAECRRADFTRFSDLVVAAHGGAHLSAPDLDRLLHDERWDPARRTRRLHAYAWDDLPDGAFVVVGAGAAQVVGGTLRVWQPDNSYAAVTLRRPGAGTASVLTPPSSLAALRTGYARPSSSSENA
ncbi:MAG: hypothetical protein HOQ18_08415 [Dermatophilaceae bacterium]|nr:hypothetical protein [Dermatophilaceae bacterium]